MTDHQVNEQNRVTAGFTAKYPNPEGVDYSHYEATIFVPITIAEDASLDDVEAAANQALGIAKRSVGEALGIETTTEVTEAGVERVTLMLADALGERPVRQKPQASGGKKSFNKGGGKGGFKKGGGSGGRKAPEKVTVGSVVVLNPINDDFPDWLSDTFDALVESGKADPDDNEVWDNRRFSPEFGGKGSENAPWFKTTDGDVVIDWGGDPVDA